MRILRFAKDGGPESRVSGFFIIEVKRLFSVVLLRFDHGTRDAYHSHAFNSVSWVLRGLLREYVLGDRCHEYRPRWRPVVTRRSTFHQVESFGTTWVLSFRGPWAKTWREYLPAERRYVTLTDGRVEA